MSGTTENDVILGALKLLGKLDCNCFTNWQDFVKSIPSMFAVEIPANITNVTISYDMPDDDQHDNLWIRLDAAGSFVGLYVYAVGDWQQIWPVPQGIFRVYGDSRSISPGYMLADATNPHLTAAQVAILQTTWAPATDGTPGVWSIFDVTYEGF